ncbi:Uncharacterized protein PBTT_05964 [Plasmodiophora brassicae]
MVDSSTVLIQDVNDVVAAAFGRQLPSGTSLSVDGIVLCTWGEEALNDLCSPVIGGQMQGRPTLIVMGMNSGAAVVPRKPTTCDFGQRCCTPINITSATGEALADQPYSAGVRHIAFTARDEANQGLYAGCHCPAARLAEHPGARAERQPKYVAAYLDLGVHGAACADHELQFDGRRAPVSLQGQGAQHVTAIRLRC